MFCGVTLLFAVLKLGAQNRLLKGPRPIAVGHTSCVIAIKHLCLMQLHIRISTGLLLLRLAADVVATAHLSASLQCCFSHLHVRQLPLGYCWKYPP